MVIRIIIAIYKIALFRTERKSGYRTVLYASLTIYLEFVDIVHQQVVMKIQQ